MLDASIAAAWLLPEGDSAAAEALIATLTGLSPVPSLFWHETRNVLLTAERRDRIAAGEAAAAMVRLRRLPLEDAGAGIDGAVLVLAKRTALAPMTQLISRSRLRGSCRSLRSTSNSRPRRSRRRSKSSARWRLFHETVLAAIPSRLRRRSGPHPESIC